MHVMHYDTAGFARYAIFTVLKNIYSFKTCSAVARIVWLYILQGGCAIEELEATVFAGFTRSPYCQVTASQAGLPEPDQK